MKNTCPGLSVGFARPRSPVPAFAPAPGCCLFFAAPLGPVAGNYPHQQTPDKFMVASNKTVLTCRRKKKKTKIKVRSLD